MSGWDYVAFFILGICIYIIERCIVPQNCMKQYGAADLEAYDYSDPGIGTGAFGSGAKKGRKKGRE